MLGKDLDGSSGDHAPVRHNNDASNPKPLPQLGDNLLERFDVSSVPRKNLPGYRPPLSIHRHAQNKLRQIRPMVSRVASLAILTLFIPIHIG